MATTPAPSALPTPSAPEDQRHSRAATNNDWGGSLLFLSSYPGVVLVVWLLYDRGLLGAWFVPALVLITLAFSHLIGKCWPSTHFVEPAGETVRHLPFAAVVSALNFFFARPLTYLLAWWLTTLLPIFPSALFNSLPAWLLIVLCLVFYEGFGYLYHRLAHQNPMIWRWVHSAHHEPSSFGTFLSLRIHYLEFFLMQVLRLLALYALPIPQSVIVAAVSISAWVAVLIHTRTRLTFGWANYLVCSPQTHLWHHDPDRRVNFGFGLLPIFDQIGGTFCYRGDQHPSDVGVHGVRQRTLLELLACRPLRLGSQAAPTEGPDQSLLLTPRAVTPETESRPEYSASP